MDKREELYNGLIEDGYSHREAKKIVADSEKCNCCGWDDYGYSHEPCCNLFDK